MRKKLLGILLAIVLVVSLLPAASAAEAEYKLVTDIANLAVGDQIVIVAKSANMALGTTQNGNNRASAPVTKSGDTVAFGDDVQVITLEAGKTAGTFAFNVGNGYLYAASSSKNYLKTEKTLSANSSWNITIATTGVATIKSAGSYTRNWMRYNASNNPPLFACYASGQTDICIYKLTASDASDCEHVWSDATCTLPKTCSECGKADGSALGHKWNAATCQAPKTCSVCKTTEGVKDFHTYVDGVCSACGTAYVPAEGSVTVSTKIADYAKNHGWVNSTQYSELRMDSLVTVTVGWDSEATNVNTAKYYTSGDQWRIYQTDVGTVTVTATENNIIASVKITYVSDKTGTLTYNGANVASGTVVEVNAPSITFGMGNTTADVTNGQARITDIEVVYAQPEPACEHEWSDATCTAPKTCSKCGETEGDALGHTMSDATCTAPKTCSVCGATEGDALGHTMSDATCQAPKTCSVCGATEGEKAGHSYVDGVCSSCGEAEPKDVAAIGDTPYATLQAALNAVKNGDTITVLKDIVFTAKDGYTYPGGVYFDGAWYTGDASFTLDLNGKTLSADDTVNDYMLTLRPGTEKSKIVIKNGTITCGKNAYSALCVGTSALDGSVLTVELQGVTMYGTKADGAILKVRGGVTVNALSGTTVTSDDAYTAVEVSDSVLNIYEGATFQHINTSTVAGEDSGDSAVGVSYGGTVNIYGGSVACSDSYGVFIYPTGGTANIYGGKISAERYALYAGEYGSTYHVTPAVINVYGGEFEGTLAVRTIDGNVPVINVVAGTFDTDPRLGHKVSNEQTPVYTEVSFVAEDSIVVDNGDGTFTVEGLSLSNAAAAIGETPYRTLAEAIKAVKEGETIQLLPGVISEGEITLPSTLKNVTIKGVEGAVLKDTTLARRTAPYVITGLTIQDVVFDNGGIIIVAWSGECALENWTITGCTFRNLSAANNVAPLHMNVDASLALKNLTFTNNVVENLTGGDKSGIYGQFTGTVIVADNVFHNIAFRPYVIQITTNDGVADTFTVTGNTFSGSAKGRAQGLGNSAVGTDTVVLTVSGNIFKGITNAQQICYWNFNPETTTADLSKNYYDIDLEANPNRIYYNKAASNVADLVEMGIYPIYTELNEDGTIDTTSLYTPAPVAKVGDVGYYDLAEAIAAAGENDVVVLIQTPDYTGLMVAGDIWYYFDNGALDTTYAGLVNYGDTWFYVADGKWDWSYSGTTKYIDTLFYVVNGVWDGSYNGLVEYNGKLYYMNGGVQDDDYTGLAQYNDVWCYLEGGVMNTEYIGLVNFGGTWFYVANGVWDFSYNGLTQYGENWFYVINGVWDGSYTGLVQRDNVWYYAENGVLNTSYTGMTQFGGTWFYVTDGVWNGSYTGLVEYNGVLFYVTGSVQDVTYNSLAMYNNVWYYVANGMADTSYTGMTQFGGTWFYAINGVWDGSYTGLVEHNGELYYVVGSVQNVTYNSLAIYNNIWHYVANGEVDTAYVGLTNFGGNLFYVANGVWDYTFSGTVDDYQVVGGVAIQ